MFWLRQTLIVSWLSLTNLRYRMDNAVVAIIGFAGVVLTVVAVLSIRAGFQATLQTTGAPDRAVVLRGGSGSEINSVLTGTEARIIAHAPGVESTSGGPLASPELLVLITLIKKSTGTDANVAFRGVGANGRGVHDQVRVVAGRWLRPGLNEVVAGVGAASRFRGLALGETFTTGRRTWHVVGLFDDGGGLHNSEIWTDLPALQAAYQRGSSVDSVFVRLASPSTFGLFERALSSDPRLNVSIERETDYFAEQAHGLSLFINIVGSIIGLLMGGGAVFGAVNTMYTAVASRAREIATLRAIGFARSSVLVSVLSEAMLLGLIGGVLGALVAYLLFNNFEASTLNQFSQVAFRFQVTPGLMVTGVLSALGMGVLGGLLPAWRAMRLPIAAGLRAL